MLPRFDASIHFLTGNPAVERLELQDANAADLACDDGGPCPLCDGPAEFSPEEEAEMERLFGRPATTHASDGDGGGDDPDPEPPAGAVRFDLMADDELIAACADESAGVELLSGASLELVRRLDARPAHRRAA